MSSHIKTNQASHQQWEVGSKFISWNDDKFGQIHAHTFHVVSWYQGLLWVSDKLHAFRFVSIPKLTEDML